MLRETIVHTVYIDAAAERVWDGLTRPELTDRYWGVTFETDWAVGSTMAWTEAGVRTEDPEQLVLAADRPHRLAYTWHTLTSEWATAHGIAEDLARRLAAEDRKLAVFELEPVDGLVRLTVRHSSFDPGTELLAMCSLAWPRLCSDLKSLLERDV